MLIYVCSPFSAPTPEGILENIENAKTYCRRVVEQGRQPMAPHLLYPRFMNDNDPAQRELGLDFAKTLLRFCDEIWVFGDMISRGMCAELELADYLGIPIKHKES